MTRGGRRVGAGRPKGHGIYGDGAVTKVMRVPQNLVNDVRKYALNKGNRIPLYTTMEQAIYPLPASSNTGEMINLHNYFVKNSEATFCVKVSGKSIIPGISEGDILVASRDAVIQEGQIVITLEHGFMNVSRMEGKNAMSENPIFQTQPANQEDLIYVLGVVTNVVKTL